MVRFIIIKQLICLIGMIVYKLILKRSTFFQFNRVYLLLVLFLSISLPLIDWTAYSKSLINQETTIYLTTITIFPSNEIPLEKMDLQSFILNTLVLVYSIGFLYKFGNFIRSIFSLIQLKKQSQLNKDQKYILAINPEVKIPFSFFKTIYWNPNWDYSNQEKESILLHEEGHVIMNHSLDNILFEMLRAFFWFSPLIHWIHREIKLIHEFQADDYTLRTIPKDSYGKLIIEQFLIIGNQVAIAHPFSSHSLKQRIEMMTQKKNKTHHLLLYIAVSLITILAMTLLSSCISDKKELSKELTVINPLSKKNNKDYSTDNTIFANVGQMPRFASCEGQDDVKKCAQMKMLEYVYTNIDYPKEARVNGVEGTVVVRFVIEKDGSLSNLQPVREIGGGTTKEVYRVLEKMPNWIPGKIDGQTVRTYFNLPVKFRLE